MQNLSISSKNKKHRKVAEHEIYFFRIPNGYFKFLDEKFIGTVVSLYNFSFYSHNATWKMDIYDINKYSSTEKKMCCLLVKPKHA